MNTKRMKLRCALITMTAIAAMVLGGCPVPPGEPTNNPPVASAGANQTVPVGSLVALSGAGSTDPDGDTLSFAWSQTAGTNPVTLNGASTATPTFTAPATADVLAFLLTVSDGRGGTDSDTVTVTVQAIVTPVTPQLFIANFNGNNVTSYRNPATVNGNIAPDTNLAGAQTQLSQPSDIVVDANGALLASNFNTNAVTGYDDAATANGNFAPARNVQGAATLLNQPTTLAINTVSDLLFVANIGSDDILVYTNASTAALNGNLPPTRRIQSAALNNPFGIGFGANDELYVANNGGNNVLVFANASTLNGNVAPTRILTSAVFTNIYDVLIDSSDRLYVVNAAGQVNVFANASTLNGAVAPSTTLTVTGASFLTAIAVDSGNTGYLVDNVANAVYAYDNIANRNGALLPDRTIQGAQTQLQGPIRVFLVE